jgi:large subunit ribosomal protein L25
MHEQSPILTAKKRERLGSRYSTRIREQGGLPAIIYGRKEDPTPVSLNAHEALGHITKGEKVFRLQMDGQKDEQTVLLKDIQFDYTGNRIVHADFARVSLTDRVTVRVPVHLIGEAKGLKTAGAILMHPTGELEIECMVTDIPEFVDVNIDELDVDHAIHASEVKLPKESMKLKTDPKAMVAQIVIQKEEVVVAPTAEAGAVEGAATEPEVITAKKKEGEEGAEGEAAKPGAKGAATAKGAAPAGKGAAAPAKGAAAASAKGGKEEKKK